MRLLPALGILAALAPGARQAAAQSPEPPRVYVGGGLGLAAQPEEFADGHYLVQSTVGGVVPEVHLTAGVRAGPRLSAGVELSLPGSVSGNRIEYVGWGYAHMDVEHRERIISALLRWHLGSLRWRVEPVGGVSWVLARTHAEGEARSLGGFPAIPTESDVRDTRFAVTGGVDVPALLSRGIAVAPFFRLHVVDRPEQPQETFAGLPRVVYRAGVMLMRRW